MIFCPIKDGSDFWASEIAENFRNEGSKKSHDSWSLYQVLNSIQLAKFKVEFQPFNRCYTQLTFFNFFLLSDVPRSLQR